MLRIMASQPARLTTLSLLALILVGPLKATAQTSGLEPPCPRLPAVGHTSFQPARIRPEAVKAKNALGCLSPNDAIYGADGCPLRMCGPAAGVLSLPGGPAAAPQTPLP
jgi:hypothetical protein